MTRGAPGVTSGRAHRLRDARHVVPPHVLGRRWQHLVPDLGHAAGQLGETRWARDEPPVQVSGALAPAADVDAADLAHGEHGALDAAEQDPLLAREVLRQVSWAVVVRARLEDQDERQATR